MKSDRERELWLLKMIDEQSNGRTQPAMPANLVKWGAIAVAGMTTASLVGS